jgi:uncharacterized protein (TIGR03083 family)
MTELSRDQLDELLGAWALDALDDESRVAVEAALARHPDLADTARALRESAAGLATLSAREGDGAEGVVASATAQRPSGIDARIAEEGPATAVEAYADQVAALQRQLERVPDDGWDRPVAAYPWTVKELVAHLVAIEAYMASFLDLAEFDPGALEHDHLAMTDATIVRLRDRPPAEVVDEWWRQADATVAHLRTLDDDRLEHLMPMHGIPFRAVSALVARAFELWTHADDIRRAIGEPRDEPPPRVIHRMANESVRSLPLAALALDQPPGPAVARVVLTGHGGGAWTLLVGGAADGGADPDLVLVADVVD